MIGLFIHRDQTFLIEPVEEPIDFGGEYHRKVPVREPIKWYGLPPAGMAIEPMVCSKVIRYQHVEIHGGCNGYELFLEM